MMHGAVAILALLVHVSVRAAPVSTPPPEKPPPDAALKFMKRFGYLEPGTPDSEALYSGEAIVEAIKTVQKFGALPQTGVLDNATLDLMQAKRCGVPDITRHKQERRKRYVVGSEGWNKREITYFIANWSPKIGEETVVQDMRRAFDAWSGYSGLKFRHVMEPNADIIVAFGRGPHGDGYPFDGPGNILAHAFYPYEMGNYGGDIHFDDDEHWMDKPGEFDEGVDFFSVAVHELGHSLGLAHSPVSTSVMFPYYKPYISTFQLDYDDILAMWNLYINRRLEENETSPSSSDDNYGGDDGSQDDDKTREDTDSEDNNNNNNDDDDDHHRKDVDSEDTSTEKDTARNRPTPTPPTRDYNVTYHGDEESVEDHKDHDDKHGIPKSPSVPDACDGYYDAVATLRGEMFIFKGKYVWRLTHRGLVQQGYPVPFRQMFWKLPENITKIDAAYQRETDGNIILFSGKNFWVYDGDSFIEGSPRPLMDYGLPGFLEKIDAAMVWNKNGKTFLFSGDRYWRYNETTRQMDPGYPHNINRWRGVPPNLDAAVTWKDGLTYFFKGKLFWRFDNLMIKTDDHYPLPAPQNWLGCPEKPDTIWW